MRHFLNVAFFLPRVLSIVKIYRTFLPSFLLFCSSSQKLKIPNFLTAFSITLWKTIILFLLYIEVFLFFTALKRALLLVILVVEMETTPYSYLWDNSICLLYTVGNSVSKLGSLLLLLSLMPLDLLFTASEHDAKRNMLVWTLGMDT